jgi:hypothetical protein
MKIKGVFLAAVFLAVGVTQAAHIEIQAGGGLWGQVGHYIFDSDNEIPEEHISDGGSTLCDADISAFTAYSSTEGSIRGEVAAASYWGEGIGTAVVMNSLSYCYSEDETAELWSYGDVSALVPGDTGGIFLAVMPDEGETLGTPVRIYLHWSASVGNLYGGATAEIGSFGGNTIYVTQNIQPPVSTAPSAGVVWSTEVSVMGDLSETGSFVAEIGDTIGIFMDAHTSANLLGSGDMLADISTGMELLAGETLSTLIEYSYAPGLVYDPARNITFLKDWSVAAGPTNWDDANAWAESFTYTSNGVTYSDWRLPATTDEENASVGELGYLNTTYGISEQYFGPFVNLSARDYWTAPQFMQDPDLIAYAYTFSTTYGPAQFWHYLTYDNGYVIPVFDGPPTERIYSGGDGSAENPYQISIVQDWQKLMATPDDWWKCFILTANIDLAGVTLTPVGTESNYFTGVFDGNDKIISNAVINQPGSDYIGLFGYTGPFGCQIRNLGVVGVNMTGNSSVGGLVGMNYYGTITDCYATGTVTGAGHSVGGLAGWNYNGSLISCHAASEVTGTGGNQTSYYIGGLVGHNDSSTLINFCYATGNVHGGSTVGGLVGYNDSVSLTSCYATGAVFGHGNDVGGLAGENDPQGVITSCYATGSVTGTGWNSGGLVGNNYHFITNCYATGSVSGSFNAAGLIGYNRSTVTACFWDTQTCLPATLGVGSGASAGVTGKTTALMKTLSTFTDAGWDFSHTDGDISDWIMSGVEYPHLIWGINVVVPDVVGQTQTNAQTTLTETELLIEITGVADDTIPAGQVISQSLDAGLTVAGGTWIHLVVSLGVHYSGGSGTETDPYQISSIRDWQVLMADSTDWDKVYSLTTDINLSGVTLTPVGNVTTKFTGIFEGNDNTLSNAVITSQPTDNNIGLFGYTGYGCQIRNLGVVGVAITGGYNAAGGLVGRNDGGTLTACYTTGSVSGTHDVGGLAGLNYGGVMTACFTTVSVSGGEWSNYVGGLVGANVYSTVTACYATGSVSAAYPYANSIGGLLGYNSNYSPITNCYATGSIAGTTYVGGLIGQNGGGTLTACFWDTDTCLPVTVGVGSGASEGVTGQTTLQMQTLLTFTGAGWDFTNETTNGTSDFWRMCANGVTYPKLSWQSAAGDFDCPDGVSTEDFYSFFQQWLLTDCNADNNFCGGGDMNASGNVDLADFAILADNWLEGV